MNTKTWTFAELAAASPRHAEALAEKTGCPNDAMITITVKKTAAYVQIFHGLCSYGTYRIPKTGPVTRVTRVPR